MKLRTHKAPPFVLGTGAIEQLGHHVTQLHAQRVLIVTDHGVAEAGWLAPVVDALTQARIETVLFSDVTPNPKDQEVMAGAERYQSRECDLVVAVGGGSPMDCAKGIVAVVANGGDVRRFAGIDRVPVMPPPLICIPTTAGTAAEISRFAIITDTSNNIKFAIISDAMIPWLALVAPETTTTMPSELTATTGIGALVHAIEAYVSTDHSPLTDLYALEAIRLIVGSIRQALAQPRNMQHREAMMQGSLLAGLAFSNAGLGLVHAMAHSLGGLLDLAHGECNALLLEHVVNYNFDSARERYVQIGLTMGLPMKGLSAAEQKIRLIAALAALRRDVNLAHPLRDLGVESDDIPALARNALLDPCIPTNPRTSTQEDITHIYEAAL